MKNFLGLAGIVAATVLLVGTAGAYSLTVNQENGTIFNIYSVADWDTTGNTIDGFSVTAILKNSSGTYTETQSWADNSGVAGAGWSVTLSSIYVPDYFPNPYDYRAP